METVTGKWTGLWLLTVALTASVALNLGMGMALVWWGSVNYDQGLALAKANRRVTQLIVKYGQEDKVDARINWKEARLAALDQTLTAREK